MLLKTASRIVFDSATRRRGRAQARPGAPVRRHARAQRRDHAAQLERPRARHLRLAAGDRGRRGRPAGARPQRQRRRRRALPRQPGGPRLVAGRRVGDQRDRHRRLRPRRRRRRDAVAAGRRRRCARRPSPRARTRWRRARTATASTSTPTRARRSTTGSPARRADDRRGRRRDRRARSSPTPASRSSPTTSRPRAGARRTSRTSSSAPRRRRTSMSVEDPYDDASPRHKWVRADEPALGAAPARLARQGLAARASACCGAASRRASWRAQVVGTGGRTSVSGPTLRRKLGLYDTWARFTVITANATRGDGNAPARAGRAAGCRPPRPAASSPSARAAALGDAAGTLRGSRRPGAGRQLGDACSAGAARAGSRASTRRSAPAGATPRGCAPAVPRAFAARRACAC